MISFRYHIVSIVSVFLALAVGGDVETTAAMTGAISGARLGLQALPLPLAYLLTDQGSWPFGKLVELAPELISVLSGEEIAKAALFLAADATATTGEVLLLDCGRTTLGPRDAAR